MTMVLHTCIHDRCCEERQGAANSTQCSRIVKRPFPVRKRHGRLSSGYSSIAFPESLLLITCIISLPESRPPTFVRDNLYYDPNWRSYFDFNLRMPDSNFTSTDLVYAYMYHEAGILSLFDMFIHG